MKFQDQIEGMWGRVEVYRKYLDGSTEKVYEGKNAITYRGKALMSRLLGGGLDPNTAPLYEWGTPATVQPLRVTGMAFGNGGHLIYNTATGFTNTLPKAAAALVLDWTAISESISLPALPRIGVGSWGYASQANRTIPGTTYEKVENGNIPWDGTVNITDNTLGVVQANTTLFSETFRIPLDAADGVSYPTATEVQYKATIPAVNLNETALWGFSARPANYVSEAGLVIGYSPSAANILANVGQVYSEDGAEPAAAGIGYTFDAAQTNWGPGGAAVEWNSKDGNLVEALDATNVTPLSKMAIDNTTYGSEPPAIVAGVDDFTGLNNKWNLLSRKTMPVLNKSATFALVFIWTVGF